MEEEKKSIRSTGNAKIQALLHLKYLWDINVELLSWGNWILTQMGGRGCSRFWTF